MKLLTVTNYFDSHRGGVEIVAGVLARNLATRGFAVKWLAAGEAGAGPNPVATISLSAWNILEDRLGVPFPLPSLGSLLRLWREVRAADAVLLHDSYCAISVGAFLAAKRFAKPVVVVQHIGEVPYRKASLRLLMRLANRFVSRPVLAAADQVVFISETTRAFFQGQKFRRPPELIFNGVDTDVFHPRGSAADRVACRARIGQAPDRPIALFVGRFVEKKGVEILAHAAQLRPEIGWVLAGWGVIDPDAWGLANVRVVRNISGAELANLYRASDALVLPSRGEGLPLVIQEALACGLPVICGEETALADPAARPWLCGVDLSGDAAQSAHRLCDALDRIIAEGAPNRAAPAAFAASRYSWQTAIDRYAALLTDLCARPAIEVQGLRS